MKKVIPFILVIIVPYVSFAQTSGELFSYRMNQQPKIKSYTIIASSHMVFGCLKSGIGSLLHNKNFLSGCAYGALGGTLTAGAVVAVSNAPYYPGAGAAGKLMNDIGLSLQDNIMLGLEPLDNLSTDIGFLSITVGKNSSIKYTVTPAAGIIAFVAKGFDFKWRQSLYNLTPVFRENGGFMAQGSWWKGIAIGNTVLYSDKSALSHELIHTLQWSRMRSAQHLGNKIPVLSRIQKDGQWNITHDLLLLGMVGPNNTIEDAYYYNPLELEAYVGQRRR